MNLIRLNSFLVACTLDDYWEFWSPNWKLSLTSPHPLDPNNLPTDWKADDSQLSSYTSISQKGLPPFEFRWNQPSTEFHWVQPSVVDIWHKTVMPQHPYCTEPEKMEYFGTYKDSVIIIEIDKTKQAEFDFAWKTKIWTQLTGTITSYSSRTQVISNLVPLLDLPPKDESHQRVLSPTLWDGYIHPTETTIAIIPQQHLIVFLDRNAIAMHTYKTTTAALDMLEEFVQTGEVTRPVTVAERFYLSREREYPAATLPEDFKDLQLPGYYTLGSTRMLCLFPKHATALSSMCKNQVTFATGSNYLSIALDPDHKVQTQDMIKRWLDENEKTQDLGKLLPFVKQWKLEQIPAENETTYVKI